MSIISLKFLIFVLVVLLVYYAVPKKVQWIVLLLGSYTFYFLAGIIPLLFVTATTAVVYLSAVGMEKIKENTSSRKAAKMKNRRIVTGTMIVLFALLFLLKYYNSIAGSMTVFFSIFSYDASMPLVNIMLPMGISFYIFQSVGYCIDVYRDKVKAEKNIARFALFISFFPQAVQGPISRFDNLNAELRKEHYFCYEEFTFGAQLMLWGFFKKLVIADRLAIIVGNVFDNYTDYDGTQIFVAIVCYALQIYTDFSGGIDIIRGASQCMGINLIENFRRPYFADSVAEYWRRWHMSLTNWMREYVFYTLALSKMSNRIGKWGRKHIKGLIGKQLPSYLPTFITFFLIGIWHGAGAGFILFGLYNATIIVLSMMLSTVFDKINRKLRINTECPAWKVWRIVRTFAIMAIGKTMTRATSVAAGFGMLAEAIHVFNFHDIIHRMLTMGLNFHQCLVLALACLVLFFASVMQERGICIREKIAEKNLLVRWTIYIAGFMAVLILGVYGVGYDASSFIYRGF